MEASGIPDLHAITIMRNSSWGGLFRLSSTGRVRVSPRASRDAGYQRTSYRKRRHPDGVDAPKPGVQKTCDFQYVCHKLLIIKN